MPWKTFEDGDQFCIHKLNADGSQGTRVPGGCHPTKAEAETHRRALEANVTEFDGSLDDFVDRVRREFDRQMRPVGTIESSISSPYVTDVFPDHAIVRDGDEYLRVAFVKTDDAITFVPQTEWEPVVLNYVTEMPLGPIRDVMIISEFRGRFPDIPLAEGVDYDALIAGDSNPVFVTLPIGKANVTSGNKRYYDDAFVAELERQVIANKPVGLMGHLRDDQRDTEFPTEAIHWVGASRIGELLWGKGYVPAGDARARLLRYKATNKSIATSIDALAEGVWDDKLSAYRMSAKSFKLNQIDIAPADRVGIADLASVPHVTTEMVAQSLGPVITGRETEMERDEVIQSLTLDDIPEPLRAEIRAAVVADMRTKLGLSGDADIVAQMEEMQQTETARQQTAITARAQELVAEGVKLESARGLVLELIQARQPHSVEDVTAVYQSVVTSENVTTLLAGQVQEIMGPGQTQNVDSQAAGNQYFKIPDREES